MCMPTYVCHTMVTEEKPVKQSTFMPFCFITRFTLGQVLLASTNVSDFIIKYDST